MTKPYLAQNGRLILRNGDGTFARPSIQGVTCPSCNWAWHQVTPERNKITPGQIKALWDYLDSIYEVACITHFCHSPEGEILVILDANGGSKMVDTPWIYSEGVAT